MKFIEPLYRFTRTTGNAGRRRTIVFLLILIAIALLYLVIGEKPWDTEFFEKWAAGKKNSLEAYITVGSWFAALLNAVLLVLLLVTAGVWLGGTHPIPVVSELNRVRQSWLFSRNGIAFWIGLVIILFSAIYLRAPRLTHSLWNDEEHPLRRYVWGELELDKKTGELEIDHVTWSESLFMNTGSNNHVAFGVTGHAALQIRKLLVGAQPGSRHFSECVYRMSPFLAGLGSIAGVAIFLALVGFPRAGLGAAALLALHPWHLRYSVEGRGYAMLLFFIMLALICLLLAVQQARWRWWCGYGIAQALYMLCFPGALYVAITVNGAALIYMGFVQRKKVFWNTQLPRFVVVNVASAMFFVQVMGPSIPQMKLYLDHHEVARGDMGMPWLVDFLSHLTAGTRWGREPGDFPEQLQFGLQHLSAGSPWLLWFLFGLLGLLTVVGLIFLFRQNTLAGCLMLALILSGPLAWLHTSSTGNLLYTWYLFHLSLPLVMLMTLGICGPAQLLPEHWNPNRICMVLIGILLIAFAWATKVPSSRIRHVDRQPLRQTVEFVRGSLPVIGDPPPELLTGIFGVSAEQIQSYDPWITVLDEPAELQELVERAQTEERPLSIIIGGPVRAVEQDTELYNALTTDPRFHRSAELWGLESMYSFAVYEMVQGTRAGDSGISVELPPSSPAQ